MADADVAPPPRIFLLSPANCGGQRARMVLAERAGFDLARRLRAPGGAPLGEVFNFVSGLYFRGKLAYARAFAAPPAAHAAAVGGGVLVIVPGAGLWPADRPLTLTALRAFARVAVSAANPRYREPLVEAATDLAARIEADCEVVLLGSIASDKYVEALAPIFGDRLRFPLDFVGRGDMSRGGLLLRCVAARRQLEYAPILGSVRRGARPPKLPALARTRVADRANGEVRVADRANGEVRVADRANGEVRVADRANGEVRVADRANGEVSEGASRPL